MLFMQWPAICASDGYELVLIRSCCPFIWRPTPITNSRFAPRCKAGLTGAIWRIEPSPKYSRLRRMAGKMKGSADDASR